MLTLADLGILRGVAAEGGRVVVSITPTYSGCPAMREIARGPSAPAGRRRASLTSRSGQC